MSKDNVYQFFTEAAQKEQLKEQLQEVSSQAELVNLGNQQGYDFSEEHVNEALAELQQKPGFFGKLAEAMFAVFSPSHDDYPAIGVQPFSGDANEQS